MLSNMPGRFMGCMLATLLLALTVAGCATLPPTQPARDVRDIAGKWTGIVHRGDGQKLPATLTIQDDGTWEHLIPALSNPGPRFVGSMTVVDGKHRFKSDTTGNTGTFTLHAGEGSAS